MIPVDGFKEKPVQPYDLVRKVNELLELKTSPWVRAGLKRKIEDLKMDKSLHIIVRHRAIIYVENI